jgi:hypothetical protein
MVDAASVRMAEAALARIGGGVGVGAVEPGPDRESGG